MRTDHVKQDREPSLLSGAKNLLKDRLLLSDGRHSLTSVEANFSHKLCVVFIEPGDQFLDLLGLGLMFMFQVRG